MKRTITTIFRIIGLFAFLLLANYGISKNDGENSKVISKNYKVDKSTRLQVTNSFGKVHVNNWEKSEFDIKVEVIAEASSDQKIQEILDRIDIEIEETSGNISFKTELNKLKTRNNERFEVNYTIYMPKENPVFLKNSFGDLYTDSRFGKAEIEVAYGALKARDFNNTDTYIKVSFGSVDAGNVKGGEVEIKYSNGEFGEMGIVELNSGFSDIEIETVNKIEVESKYGSLELGKVNEIDIDIEFSKFEIGELNGYLDMDASYVSGFEIDRVTKDFQFIYIESKFGSSEIKFDSDASADFEGEFEFCDLRVSGIEIDYSVKIREDNESEYKAKIGTGNTDNKRVRIFSSYGDVRLSEY